MSSGGFSVKSRPLNGGTGTKCGRWNPTAEQVKLLTDLFKAGLRTPTTDEIQKISMELSLYGKIESKNVFYWFQNHKARERQKRRKICTVDFDNGNNNISVPKEEEKVIETLQLFPLSKVERVTQEMYNNNNNNNNTTTFSTFSSCGAEMEHPPLDLRLSFL